MTQQGLGILSRARNLGVDSRAEGQDKSGSLQSIDRRAGEATLVCGGADDLATLFALLWGEKSENPQRGTGAPGGEEILGAYLLKLHDMKMPPAGAMVRVPLDFEVMFAAVKDEKPALLAAKQHLKDGRTLTGNAAVRTRLAEEQAAIRKHGVQGAFDGGKLVNVTKQRRHSTAARSERAQSAENRATSTFRATLLISVKKHATEALKQTSPEATWKLLGSDLATKNFERLASTSNDELRGMLQSALEKYTTGQALETAVAVALGQCQESIALEFLNTPFNQVVGELGGKIQQLAALRDDAQLLQAFGAWRLELQESGREEVIGPLALPSDGLVTGLQAPALRAALRSASDRLSQMHPRQERDRHWLVTTSATTVINHARALGTGTVDRSKHAVLAQAADPAQSAAYAVEGSAGLLEVSGRLAQLQKQANNAADLAELGKAAGLAAEILGHAATGLDLAKTLIGTVHAEEVTVLGAGLNRVLGHDARIRFGAKLITAIVDEATGGVGDKIVAALPYIARL